MMNSNSAGTFWRVWLSMPNSRPIDPMFAGNYGATEAGAIRGGMQAAK